jgi:hypothetical protein
MATSADALKLHEFKYSFALPAPIQPVGMVRLESKGELEKSTLPTTVQAERSTVVNAGPGA